MKKRKSDDGKITLLYMIAGIVLALSINYGMALVFSTSYPIVAVESNSMVPTFYRGDILIVQGVPPNQLKVGDTIIFSVPGKPVPIVHRIITVNEDGTFQTKGDANSGQHPWETKILSEQIKVKEVFILPLFGWVKIGMTEIFIPNIVVFSVIGVVIIFIYLQTNKKERRKRN